ncbi:MAG: hypothetical protein HYS24_07270 [Ignavibacteriales bacterium]|nr:hypothetical protein [Ignavibacteriales bacterium]
MKKTENEKPNTLGGLKQIREIIFGEYLDNLQNQINQLRDENKNLKQQVSLHDKNLEKASSQISDLFSKSKNSDTNIQKSSEELYKIKTELESKIKELKLTKIDKNQIGQVFIEWGMKVKQEEGQ